MPFKSSNKGGFTLIEIAIVMVIIGLLAGGGVSLMGMLSERKIRNQTLEYLSASKEALINFARINGRLPWADSNNDGMEDSGVSSGALPFVTLRTEAVDAQKNRLKYVVNSALSSSITNTCSALRAGLTGAPLVVDADGSPSSFPVAAVLISSGPMDADASGDVFDDVTTGAFRGDNTDGNPNYIRHAPDAVFDDLVIYISEYALYGAVCGRPHLAVKNNSAADIFVFDMTASSDIGIVTPGQTVSYEITSGNRITLRNASGGGGSIVASVPATPVVVAGEGAVTVVP